MGRQPWIIYGVMRTHEAVTPMPGLVVPFVIFTAVYIFLAVVVVYLLAVASFGDRLSWARPTKRGNSWTEVIVAIFILSSLIVYALMGGADFGVDMELAGVRASRPTAA